MQNIAATVTAALTFVIVLIGAIRQLKQMHKTKSARDIDWFYAISPTVCLGLALATALLTDAKWQIVYDRLTALILCVVVLAGVLYWKFLAKGRIK